MEFNIFKQMKSELEKLRSGQLGDTSSHEMHLHFVRAKKLLLKYNQTYISQEGAHEILEELIPNIPSSTNICPPFYCDFGHGIRLGEKVYVNAFCTFLDGAYITIGNRTLIGPNVGIYTSHHPIDYIERRQPKEYCYPVTIGEDCWIGGGAIICPGVTIGNRCIVAAGSVVTKDVSDDSMVAGNPAKIKKKLNQ